eukprot:CAMPEP_0170211992 /NCGR_PEP_ID=MMETSP0116_2-20130129/5613_1 /TAXON_ID=400756 /ORGANISM="Durinskia baltica, Strain CSIRO CS-38" /LENGTH=313 /DNA_ID=CAMNT_0010462529 /DNA_START=15 /DNA_END=956 /DNA_ORIENTATION=+
MWFHLDSSSYSLRYVGVARATKPTGPFEFVHGFRPDGLKSLDMSLFMDPVDHQAYFIRSVDNAYVGISRLSEEEALGPDVRRRRQAEGGQRQHRRARRQGEGGEVSPSLRHAPRLCEERVRPGGRYKETVFSHCIIEIILARSSLCDHLDVAGNPTGCATSFNSQPASVVPYKPAGGGEPYFVYMADDWILCPGGNPCSGPSSWFPSPDLEAACYVWLPLRLDDDPVSLDWRPAWDVNDPFARPPEHHPMCSSLYYVWIQGYDTWTSRSVKLIVLAWVALLVLICAACCWCCRRLANRKQDQAQGAYGGLPGG